VPGEVGSSRSRGVHRLIRQGAKLVESVQDIIEEIAPQLSRPGGEAGTQRLRALPASAHTEARQTLALLHDCSLHIDEIIEATGLSASRVSQILLELELQGFVKQLPGNRFTAER
jgi:DNA processing protein